MADEREATNCRDCVTLKVCQLKHDADETGRGFEVSED